MNRFVTLALVCTVALSVASHAFGQEEKPSAAEITKLLPGKWVSKVNTPKCQQRSGSEPLSQSQLSLP